MARRRWREPGRPAVDPVVAAMSDEQHGLFDGRGDIYATVEDRFNDWIASPEGRMVEAKFVSMALDAKSRGLRRYGAKAIWESLRWHFSVEKGMGEEFKLNNNYTALMARRAEKVNAQLVGFFEKRRTAADL